MSGNIFDVVNDQTAELRRVGSLLAEARTLGEQKDAELKRLRSDLDGMTRDLDIANASLSVAAPELERLRAQLLDAFNYRDVVIRERDELITASANEVLRDNAREAEIERLRTENEAWLTAASEAEFTGGTNRETRETMVAVGIRRGDHRDPHQARRGRRGRQARRLGQGRVSCR